MTTSSKPVVGDWYKTRDGISLEVTVFDDETDSVNIQYFDGTIAELPLDEWNRLELTCRPPPEHWSGSRAAAIDVAEENVANRTQWVGPLDGTDD